MGWRQTLRRFLAPRVAVPLAAWPLAVCGMSLAVYGIWLGTCLGIDPGSCLELATPVARAGVPRELRALWLDNGTLARLGGREATARLMAQLQQAGFNAVFVESLFRGYTLYPGPYQDPRFSDWPEDPLRVAVEEARRHGLQVHGWMWALGAGIHGEAGPILKAHPDWTDRNADASPFSATASAMPWLDPSRPEVRAFLAEQAVYLATRYSLDGIHLDYIRYSDDGAVPFGYAPHALQAFAARTGLDLRARRPAELSPAERAEWNRWREEQVTSVVAAVRQALNRQAPGVALSAAVAPELSVARLLFLQDWRRWLADGLVDFVVPMAYTASAPNLQDILDALRRDLQALAPWRDPQALLSRVVVGLALFSVPPEAVAEQVLAVRRAGAAGTALFAAAYLSLPARRALAEGPFRESAEVPALARSPLAGLAPVPWQPPPEPLTAVLPYTGPPAPAESRGEPAAGEPAGSDGGGSGLRLPSSPGGGQRPRNLARSARVRVDSSFRGYSAAPLTDGVRNDVLEVGRWAEVAWASAEIPGEHWVELRWPEPVTVTQVDIYWALDRGRFFPSRQLILQAEGPDGQWQPVWELQWHRAGHRISRTSITTAPFTTSALRLVQPPGGGPEGRPDLMWIAEIEVY